jgi:hypothetical protein
MRGSSRAMRPDGRLRPLCYAWPNGGVAQPGRALPSHGRGQGFKSPHLHGRCRSLAAYLSDSGEHHYTPGVGSEEASRAAWLTQKHTRKQLIRWRHPEDTQISVMLDSLELGPRSQGRGTICQGVSDLGGRSR